MKRRLLGILLAGIMVLGLLPTALSAQFTDVPAGHYSEKAINWAVEQGITNGTGDGTTFSPDVTCTRAQILTFLWRAAGSPKTNLPSGYFQDVPADAYYSTAVRWATEKSIASTSGSNFKPDTPCSRTATMEYFWKYGGWKDTTAVSFKDVPAGTDAAKAISWAVNHGITNGTGDGTTFSPNETCTRGQIVTFLYRYFVEPLDVTQSTTPAPAPDESMTLDPLPPKDVTKQPDWYMSLTQPSQMSNARLVAEYQQLMALTSDDTYRTEPVLVREGDLSREVRARCLTIRRYNKYKYNPEGYQEILNKGDISVLEPYM